MIRRRFSKRDGNHTEIVRALRAVGVLVIELHALGGDVPDLLCVTPRGLVLLEIKVVKGKLTPGQETFFAAWRGPPGSLVVVRSVAEALAAVGARCYTVAHDPGSTGNGGEARPTGPARGRAAREDRGDRRRVKAA